MDRSRRRSRRTCVLAAATVLVTAVPLLHAAGAAAVVVPAPDVGPVLTLTSHGHEPEVVVDRSGNTTVVWASDWWRGRIRAVRRPAGGKWGPAVTIGRGGASPEAAVDGRGDVTVVFQTNRRFRTTGLAAVRRRVGHGWGRPVRVRASHRAPTYDGNAGNEGTFGVHRVELDVNARGDATAIWQWGSYDRGRPFRIEAAYRRVGGNWSRPETLTRRNWSEEPTAAVGPRGDVTAAYTSDEGWALARRRVLGQGWRPPVRVVRASTLGADVVVDGRGTATLTYGKGVGGRQAVWATRRPADTAGWTRARRVSTWDAGFGGDGAQVVHASGAITLAVLRESGRIDVVRRPPDGPWLSPRPISLPGRVQDPPRIAANRAGDIFVLWQHDVLGLRGRAFHHDGGWTTSLGLWPTGRYVSELEPAVYPGGDALAVWETDPARIRARRIVRD